MIATTKYSPSSTRIEGKEVIQAPEEVEKMLLLHTMGWGSKRISKELGCSRNTVKRYLKQEEWKPYGSPQRAKKLSNLEVWLSERFRRHAGNADVVRQDLKKELGIDVSLRTVERAVAKLRMEIVNAVLATERFETAPGQQLQIDFGTRMVSVGGELVKIHVFVAVLGYSRRIYAQAFTHERQSAWFEGLENAFRHFGGLTKQVLVDNASPLVTVHNRQTGEIVFNERFKALCKYYGVTPRACAPYRARTKGKDERGVGYVKKNALAGHHFESMEGLNSDLLSWIRNIADARIHGTTGETPQERFERDERQALRPLEGKAPFLQIRELTRQVANDAFVDLDTNRYSLPWQLIGERVTVTVSDQVVLIHHAGKEVARHAQSSGRHKLVREPSHFKGLFKEAKVNTRRPLPPPRPELLRSLQEYEDAAGGSF